MDYEFDIIPKLEDMQFLCNNLLLYNYHRFKIYRHSKNIKSLAFCSLQ
jgi:hypothetical protein